MTIAVDHDTKLFVNKQPGGMFVVRDAAECPGRVWWVGSNVTAASDSAGFGQNPGAPFATLDYAFDTGNVLADRGDVVYVLPSHAETAATDVELFDVDAASATVIGLGVGDKRPTFTITHADATVVLGAAGCRLSNLRFITGVADCVTAIEVEAAATGCVIDHCYVADTASGTDLLVAIAVEADADRLMIVDNHFNCVTGGEATEIGRSHV